ncbi:MAG: FAD-dependent oxidoreductase [Clostridiales bacterium]|jgi:thioredoxin reductase (NADPH)|nr:FAD-dependent oxidoreductase [Clostridiales bacterium]
MDICVIGRGPAGISAALYTARAGFATAIIAKDSGALDKAKKIENYYGFDKPINGRALLARGVAQAKRLGVAFFEEEVTTLEYGDGFKIKTNKGAYTACAVILATGAPRKARDIKGLAGFEGAGVSYCAICDGFFYKNKPVGVLGCCEYAWHEVQALQPLASSVVLLTNGEAPMRGLPGTLPVYTAPIDELAGGDRLKAAILQDGTRVDVEGLFIAQGMAGSVELARKLGAGLEGNSITVDEQMQTTIPGVYAAGDCTGGMMQIAKAVWQGAAAGAGAAQYMRKGTAYAG